MPRTYDNSRRARAAARTAARIVAVTEELLATRPVGDVTLQAIAEGADVSVQTVLRHMGSRDGCFQAVAEQVQARVAEQRGQAAPGDVEGALDELLAHYEAEGRLVLRLLAQEGGAALADQAAAAGRAFHRAWVRRVLGPCLDDPDDAVAVDALVAATDLYVWKLLRLDLGREPSATRAAMARLVHAVLEAPCRPS